MDWCWSLCIDVNYTKLQNMEFLFIQLPCGDLVVLGVRQWTFADVLSFLCKCAAHYGLKNSINMDCTEADCLYLVLAFQEEYSDNTFTDTDKCVITYTSSLFPV